MGTHNPIFLPCFLENLLLLLVLAFISAGAAPERSTWIVHMDKSLMPKPFSSHHHWYSSTIDTLQSNTHDLADQRPAELLYSYHNTVHGFSALLSSKELEALKSTPGFVSAHADKELILDTTHTPEFLSLNPASGLWPASAYGENVVIGVIDSGVWPESKSFSDDGMKDTPLPAKWKGTCQAGDLFPSSTCNGKLIGARYFNKGLRASDPDVNITINSARDTDGHGTHTASTAAGNYVAGVSFFGYANGTARGIAPRARLAIYKVSWKEGSRESDWLAGMDQAVADGVDVISISMGQRIPGPIYEDSFAIASFGAMEKGVLVSSSAGNRGPDHGTTSKGIPWALVVAAGTVDRKLAGTLSLLGNGVNIVGWTMFPALAQILVIPLVYNKTLSACDSSLLLAEVRNAIIICDQLGIVAEQLDHVASSPVNAAVFVADEFEISKISNFPCPGIIISPRDVAAVINYATTNSSSGNQPFASMSFHETVLGTKPAPAAARYTSRGPSRSFPNVLKPDVMAPGSRILAAWIPNDLTTRIGPHGYLPSEYNIISGTSMACPHVSGVAALLKGAHPEWSPAAIRSALMTTANPLDNTLGPILDEGNDFKMATPLAFGSGQIDPNRALDPGLVYDVGPDDYVKQLCGANLTADQIQTITRSKSYNCSNATLDLNYPSFIVLYEPSPKQTTLVQKFDRTVTNVGTSSGATYSVTVTHPRNSKVVVSPEKLVFRKKYEKRSYTVTVRYKISKDWEDYVGSIVWVESNGKHSVRSPIVVTPLRGLDE